ncbi:hypothetical protein TSAR_015609 [Trichomalopsis sarcophagae]|uniref:Uncharacterized protein n=1 Tax=Trichomalopsis sarcophagae TaxID=543379 RepID=A0A232F1F0_9HYME|nr:hypothetical protein TSAR_015609 [Trichomalopsis sarcophagae]
MPCKIEPFKSRVLYKIYYSTDC